MSKKFKPSAQEVMQWFSDSYAVVVNDDFVCYPSTQEDDALIYLAPTPDMDEDETVILSLEEIGDVIQEDNLSYTFSCGTNVKRLVNDAYKVFFDAVFDEMFLDTDESSSSAEMKRLNELIMNCQAHLKGKEVA